MAIPESFCNLWSQESQLCHQGRKIKARGHSLASPNTSSALKSLRASSATVLNFFNLSPIISRLSIFLELMQEFLSQERTCDCSLKTPIPIFEERAQSFQTPQMAEPSKSATSFVMNFQEHQKTQRKKWTFRDTVEAVRALIVAILLVVALALPGILPHNVEIPLGNQADSGQEVGHGGKAKKKTLDIPVGSIILFLAALAQGIDQFLGWRERNADRTAQEEFQKRVLQHEDQVTTFQQDQIRKQKEKTRYADQYTTIISECLPILLDVNTYGVEQSEIMAQTLLYRICQIVKLYHTGEPSLDATGQHGLNATLWLAAGSQGVNLAELGPSARFLDPQEYPRQYPQLLVLKLSANNRICVEKGFVLPIRRDPSRLLPGAVSAYVHGIPNAISDIKDQKEIEAACTHLDGPTKAAIWEHFNARSSYYSFASLPLKARDKTVGALNIHSMEVGYFSKDNQADPELMAYVWPFCVALAFVTQQWIKKELEVLTVLGKNVVE